MQRQLCCRTARRVRSTTPCLDTCVLHDKTPKTFRYHVLNELNECAVPLPLAERQQQLAAKESATVVQESTVAAREAFVLAEVERLAQLSSELERGQARLQQEQQELQARQQQDVQVLQAK